MTKLLLKAIAFFGRFFALVIFLICMPLVIYWFSLLDTSLIWFVVLGFVAVPIFLASTALVAGMFLPDGTPMGKHGIQREEAPELFDLIDEAFDDGKKRKIRLYWDDVMTANVRETRRFFGLFGTNVILVLGTPLLAVVDKDALLAILKHEFGHVKFNDTDGARKTAEFYRCFVTVFDFFPPGETVTGTVIFFLLGDFATLTHNEEMRLSREAEIKADRFAAKAGDAKNMARALRIVSSTSHYMVEEIYKPLDKEILQSSSVPPSGYSRFMDVAGSLDGANGLRDEWKAALEEPEEENSSHPSDKARLAALEISPDQRFAQLGKRALQLYFSPKAITEMADTVENSWHENMEDLYGSLS